MSLQQEMTMAARRQEIENAIYRLQGLADLLDKIVDTAKDERIPVNFAEMRAVNANIYHELVLEMRTKVNAIPPELN